MMPAQTPLEPLDDFGQHHTLVHLLLAVDALGQRVVELASASPASTQPHESGDDFAFALLGLAALRDDVRAMT